MKGSLLLRSNVGRHMEDNLKLAKAYVKGISTKAKFNDLLNELMFSDEEKRVLCEIYLNKKQIAIIASELGYSEQTVKRIHRRALTLISNYVYEMSYSR